MALFALFGVLRGVLVAAYSTYASPQTLERTKRLSVNGGRHKGNTDRTMWGRIAVPTSLDGK